MSQTNLRLIRLLQTPEETKGVLLVDGDPLFFTLEPPKRDNKPFRSCIDTGTYKCRVYQSNHFKTLCIELLEVYGHSDIKIHYGNTAKDTTGCILVGQKSGYLEVENMVEARAVLYSKAALRHLVSIVTRICQITIVEVF